jgi:hypothetical protein
LCLDFPFRHGPSTPEESHDTGFLCSSTPSFPSPIPEYGIEGSTSLYPTCAENLIHLSSQLAQKWKDDVVSVDPKGQTLVNVNSWLSRTTLDIIAESKCPCCYDVMILILVVYVAGFDTHFGSLNDEQTHLALLHENLLWVNASLFYVQVDDNLGQC